MNQPSVANLPWPGAASRLLWLLFAALIVVAAAPRSAPGQNYKQLPPAGIEIDAEIRQALESRLQRLETAIDEMVGESEDAAAWRPDVAVLVRAVRLALDQNLFFKPNDPQRAEELLELASERLEAVRAGRRGLQLLGYDPETTGEPQLLVGGFVSRVDDSVQPYGVVLPAGFDPQAASAYRLDVWLHGRGDTKTEVPFLIERLNKPGQYTPAETIVLHPFGRHCNAFKFAGETDVYEAMQRLGELVAIDRDRIAIRGFSMGGAGCWHFAVHDPAHWFAANPGAGFVDTLVYQGWKDSPPFELDAIQRKLLRWYDVLPWVTNLKNTRVIAYSGEVDKQKQAADRVMAASQQAGFRWPYVIGAGMGHKIDPASADEITEQLAQWAGSPPPKPTPEIDFVTYTLRYATADWLQVTGLREHWQAGRVRGRVRGNDRVRLETSGVTHLALDFSDSSWPAGGQPVTVEIDGDAYRVTDEDQAAGLQARFVRREAGWRQDVSPTAGAGVPLRKRPGLQGPIDDAFTDRFLWVLPSRPAGHGAVQRWIDEELTYAQRRWREIMRGEVRTVLDAELTEQQIAENHLVCFGDFQSNRYLAQIASRLPIRWSTERLEVAGRSHDPATHAPVFCFPNPQQPERYVVVNSGITFRDFSNNSNSRQIAMLPDWAVVDVTAGERAIYPGRVVDKGFFDERWRLPDSGRE